MDSQRALTGGSLRMGLPDGKTVDTEAKPDHVMPVQAARSHTTTNTGKTPIEVIVIEMKGARTGSPAAIPALESRIRAQPSVHREREQESRT